VGLEVSLLDMVPPGAEDRSILAKKALETLKKLKPSPLHLGSHLQGIRPGNFEDDWKELKDADWVFEAVIEDLEIKRQLFAKAAPVVKKTAVVTSNTSGLGIGAMTQHLPIEVGDRGRPDHRGALLPRLLLPRAADPNEDRVGGADRQPGLRLDPRAVHRDPGGLHRDRRLRGDRLPGV
jgi:hypothetical protein